ncbi:unnamed protein product [Closterium sp. NIES-64]|nr:unnamed protein product [Closterium sp. NIES-64]
MEFLKKLRQLDAYPKVNEDFYSRTMSGGILTLLSSVVMAVLFITELRMIILSHAHVSCDIPFISILTLISPVVMAVLFITELRLFLQPKIVNELSVDLSRGETLKINLDVTFPRLSCAVLSLDAMDISGEQHLDVVHNIYKRRLTPIGLPVEGIDSKHEIGAKQHDVLKKRDKFGNVVPDDQDFCGSCYGAAETDDQCCNNCEEVREAYNKRGWAFNNADAIEQCKREDLIDKIQAQVGEGCNMYGVLEVNKVAGNFHFAPAKVFYTAGISIFDLVMFHDTVFNISHTVNSLSFGAKFPGAVNPLDNNLLVVKKSISSLFDRMDGLPSPLFFIKLMPHMSTPDPFPMQLSYLLSLPHRLYPMPAAVSRAQWVQEGESGMYQTQWVQEGESGMYQYFVKVVPTMYTDSHNHTIASNQFSVTEHFRPAPSHDQQSLPGVFFFYDLSPIKARAPFSSSNIAKYGLALIRASVPCAAQLHHAHPPAALSRSRCSASLLPCAVRMCSPACLPAVRWSQQVQYSERYTSFLHFLTNVCAIVGGIFTVTGMEVKEGTKEKVEGAKAGLKESMEYAKADMKQTFEKLKHPMNREKNLEARDEAFEKKLEATREKLERKEIAHERRQEATEEALHKVHASKAEKEAEKGTAQHGVTPGAAGATAAGVGAAGAAGAGAYGASHERERGTGLGTHERGTGTGYRETGTGYGASQERGTGGEGVMGKIKHAVTGKPSAEHHERGPGYGESATGYGGTGTGYGASQERGTGGEGVMGKVKHAVTGKPSAERHAETGTGYGETGTGYGETGTGYGATHGERGTGTGYGASQERGTGGEGVMGKVKHAVTGTGGTAGERHAGTGTGYGDTGPGYGYGAKSGAAGTGGGILGTIKKAFTGSSEPTAERPVETGRTGTSGQEEYDPTAPVFMRK